MSDTIPSPPQDLSIDSPPFLIVEYVSSGTRSRQTNGTTALTPGYPSSPVAGYLFILRYGHLSSASQLSATYNAPGGWTPQFVADTQASERTWVYSKISDGTETGTVSISVTGGNSGTNHAARIDMYSGVDTTTNHGVYAGAIAQATSATTGDASVTTTSAGDMAVNCIQQSSNSSSIGDFAGESGGAWTMAAQETGSPIQAIAYCQVDNGTIGGGTYANGASSPWITRGFALKSVTILGQPMAKRFGLIPSSRRISGVF